jgi:glycosyltransferase involved in cell wall biosynthesis
MSQTPRLAYIAYPTSLVLKSANAVQTYLTCRNLRQLAPDTLIVVPRWLRQPSRFGQVGAVHLPRIAVGKFSRFWKTTLLYYLERSLFAFQVAAYLLLQRLRGRPCGVLYVREVICAYWLLRLRRLLGARVVYEAHDLESRNPSRAKERWVQPWLRRLDRRLLTEADGVVSLTDTFAQFLEQQGWRPAEQVVVIPDAFDETIFQPLDRSACRAELGIDPAAQVILYAGLTFSYRGLEHLVDAFARLPQAFPRVQLYLVGGRHSEIVPLRAQAETLGVADRLFTPGQVPLEVVPRYLNAADLLVIPGTVTDETASPLKMFEYMAVGVPLVSVDRASLREILPPDAALYFPPEDVAGLEAVLRQILERPEVAAGRAEQARQSVQRYTYRWRAERILYMVRELGN